MTSFSGWGSRVRGLFTDTKGPWGSSGSDGGGPPSGDDGNSANGPWGEPPRRGRRPGLGGSNVSALDELVRRSRERFGGGGGGGGGFPGRPDRSLIIWAILGFVLIWLVFTSTHSIAPAERGVVTQFGRYSRTLGPGVSFTLPSPIERVKKINVEKVQTFDLGASNADDLMLTGDQNLLDLAYTEDSQADVDMNVVKTGGGLYIELQGTAEALPFGREALNRLLDLADTGIRQLIALQRGLVGQYLATK